MPSGTPDPSQPPVDRLLIEAATGRPLSAEPFLTHLRATVAEVYGVS